MNMPLRTCIPCEKIEEDCYDWYARHARKLAEVKTKKADIVFIGDSITHFWNDEDGIGNGTEVWNEYYGKRSVLNLGYGFDRTQNMLWRIDNGELDGQNPRLFVLNAGTNQFSITPNYDGDTPEAAFAGVKKLIDTLYERFPAAEFVVMGVFPRLPQECWDKIIRLNQFAEEYIAGKDRIKFLDIRKEMTNPDGSFNPDLYVDRVCHPNNAGYRIWAEALEKEIRRIENKSENIQK